MNDGALCACFNENETRNKYNSPIARDYLQVAVDAPMAMWCLCFYQLDFLSTHVRTSTSEASDRNKT